MKRFSSQTGFLIIIPFSFLRVHLWTVNDRMINGHIPVTSAVTKFNLTLTHKKTSTTSSNVCFVFYDNTVFPWKTQLVLCTQSLSTRESITNLENKEPVFNEWPVHLSVIPISLIWTSCLSGHFIHLCKWLAGRQHLLYQSGSSRKNRNHMRSFNQKEVEGWKNKKWMGIVLDWIPAGSNYHPRAREAKERRRW